MTGSGGVAAGPGWYPAPDRPGQVRWWDGRMWSAYYQPMYMRGAVGRSPLRQGAPIYGWAIWLVTLLPYVAFALELAWYPTFQYRTVVSGGRQVQMLDPGSVFTPLYFVTMVSGILAYGLAVWFAYLDSRRLEAEGVVRPFHWAWTFLSSIVYVIGRSVIVHQVARPRGLAPVWVFAAAFVLTNILMIFKMMSLIPMLTPSIPA
ncbi:DUF2510 domain-containing protein [Sinomonas albida]|uniref:DUF2510 domain-containing protein n=1 Tax=Sinomonas albida TaxID=369942 RepID=UPI001457CEA9|nr:DUF2510 domain-containing protein [Sinomonas albida]